MFATHIYIPSVCNKIEYAHKPPYTYSILSLQYYLVWWLSHRIYQKQQQHFRINVLSRILIIKKHYSSHCRTQVLIFNCVYSNYFFEPCTHHHHTFKEIFLFFSFLLIIFICVCLLIFLIHKIVGSVASKSSVQNNGTVTVTTVPVASSNNGIGNTNVSTTNNTNNNSNNNNGISNNVNQRSQSSNAKENMVSAQNTTATVKKPRPKTSSPTRHGPQQCQVNIVTFRM